MKTHQKAILIAGVILSAVIFYFIFSMLYTPKAPPSETGFLSSLTKIAEQDKYKINSSLLEFGFASIIFQLDSNSSLGGVLAELTKEEFQQQDYSDRYSVVVQGRAAKTALIKLQENEHVLRITAPE